MTQSEANDEGVYLTMLAGIADKMPEAVTHVLSQMSEKDRQQAEMLIDSGRIALRRQK
jgi:hypothetical protein